MLMGCLMWKLLADTKFFISLRFFSILPWHKRQNKTKLAKQSFSRVSTKVAPKVGQNAFLGGLRPKTTFHKLAISLKAFVLSSKVKRILYSP